MAGIKAWPGIDGILDEVDRPVDKGAVNPAGMGAARQSRIEPTVGCPVVNSYHYLGRPCPGLRVRMVPRTPAADRMEEEGNSASTRGLIL